ncbi:uncharacterized protein EV420DRAFT_1274798 [Desarmillaria tabescens]|uniref:Uncharacterized protein n=1 Tax=Armillaria tabescens TaxID=1929756 RepID=A0AA39JWY2_ARMTA|nr:uncharacterized protein EV420DRAFT_1274798 [Desarmillaria tabescens]KAK0450442.1 hypothetical protein EV420DRAFT_1274798 [Desarmillaria tabescens]
MNCCQHSSNAPLTTLLNHHEQTTSLSYPLSTYPLPSMITIKNQMHTALEDLDHVIQKTIELYVPWTKPSLYIKR